MERIPYRFKPRPYQLPLLRAMQSGTKRAVVVWHRRSGKDKVCLNALIALMAESESKGKIGTYYYFFPKFSQGRKVLWEGIDGDGLPFLSHFPKDYIVEKHDGDMRIKTRNGSVFQIIGTDNIDSIMGTNPIGCVFSEYALQHPDAWNYVRPILAENNGWAIFAFTPRGRNHAYHLLEQAKGQPEWFVEVLKVSDTNAIPADRLEIEQKQMPIMLFRQEYLCEFQDGADQFFKGARTHVSDKKWTPSKTGQYRLGVDLAKYQDFTVIAPLDLSTFTIGQLDRFNGIDYPLQEAKIQAAYYYYNRAPIYIDTTGVGDPVCDHLRKSGLRLEPIRFTESMRYDLLVNLQLLLEQGKIKLPNDEQLLSELESFRYELTERGKVRISVPDGLHDDCVMAVALAVWNLPQKPLAPYEPEGSMIRMPGYNPKQGCYDWTDDIWNNKSPNFPIF